MKKIAVLGYGTVGSGVVELFHKNYRRIAAKAGDELSLAYILDLRDFPDSPYADIFVKSIDPILNDDSVEVVAECMGGTEPAFTFLMECLRRGKSVVTSNKELIANKGAELLAEAKAHSCNCFFEASVGGAIPIIRPLHRCLAANDITAIYGILNGTTNFILNQMIAEHMTFDDALALAQKLGYAERDPRADIDGHDACRKICILSSLAFGKHVYPESVHTEGIRSITREDVQAASGCGGAIKLIAFVERLQDGRILPAVMPMYVPEENMIAGVNGVFNCVEVCGDAIDKAYFCGRGAGKLPTASAVMGDVIEAVKHHKTVFSQFWVDSGTQDFVADIDELECGIFVRFAERYDSYQIKAAVEKWLTANGHGGWHIMPSDDAFVIDFLRLTKAERDALVKSLEADGLKAASILPVLTDPCEES